MLYPTNPMSPIFMHKIFQSKHLVIYDGYPDRLRRMTDPKVVVPYTFISKTIDTSLDYFTENDVLKLLSKIGDGK